MFEYSDTNKRYHTQDYEYKKVYGGKVGKLSLDGGFTCPNRDGTCGTGGCIYCSARGSGDFTDPLPLPEQIERQKAAARAKWGCDRFIAYFQAFTSTYAPTDELEKKYRAVLSDPGVVGLNVGTRADCLTDETVRLLTVIAEETVLTVELGLQTSSDKTARLINRGYSFDVFRDAVRRLRNASQKIRIGIHLIFGLPGENGEIALQSVRDAAALEPDEIKIHTLHVLRNTGMEALWLSGGYTPLEKEEYVTLVADALELIPAKTVIARLTGDGKDSDLLAPRWTRQKREVLNAIDMEMARRDCYQGDKA